MTANNQTAVADGTAEVSGEVRLRIENVSKSFRHVTALDDVSLTFDENVVGLVGENGAGKSTLLNILSGTLQPDEGRILLDDEPVTLARPQDAIRKGIFYVHQEQEVIPNLTGYENIFMGNDKQFSRFGITNEKKMHNEARDIIDDLGFEFDVEKPVSKYSFNERQELDIAKAFVLSRRSDRDHPVILLDEPTAALNEEGRERLFRLIRSLKDRSTFVFVSHELDEVLEITNKIYVLKDGKVVDEVRTEEATAESLQRSMVGRETSSEYYRIPDQIEDRELGEPVLEAKKLEIEDEIGPLDFSLRKGEILGVAGVEGSGKERLGRMLAGDLPPTSGTLTVNGEEVVPDSVATMVNAGVGYIPKERQSEGLLLYQPITLNTNLAIIDEMYGWLPFIDTDREVEVTERMIEELNVIAPGRKSLVHSLSGGNQQKVVLSRWLAKDSPVLVMDNVTRGIDVGAKEEVYRLCRELTESGVSILFIGDEMPEVIGMSNRIMVMNRGQLADIVDAPKDGKPTEEALIEKMV